MEYFKPIIELLDTTLGSLPPDLRLIAFGFICFLAYKLLRYYRPAISDAEDADCTPLSELREDFNDLLASFSEAKAEIDHIEVQVSNHLATAIKELGASVAMLTGEVRNMKEESGKVARSMNVLMNKQDQSERTEIEIKTTLTGLTTSINNLTNVVSNMRAR